MHCRWGPILRVSDEQRLRDVLKGRCHPVFLSRQWFTELSLNCWTPIVFNDHVVAVAEFGMSFSSPYSDEIQFWVAMQLLLLDGSVHLAGDLWGEHLLCNMYERIELDSKPCRYIEIMSPIGVAILQASEYIDIMVCSYYSFIHQNFNNHSFMHFFCCLHLAAGGLLYRPHFPHIGCMSTSINYQQQRSSRFLVRIPPA